MITVIMMFNMFMMMVMMIIYAEMMIAGHGDQSIFRLIMMTRMFKRDLPGCRLDSLFGQVPQAQCSPFGVDII